MQRPRKSQGKTHWLIHPGLFIPLHHPFTPCPHTSNRHPLIPQPRAGPNLPRFEASHIPWLPHDPYPSIPHLRGCYRYRHGNSVLLLRVQGAYVRWELLGCRSGALRFVFFLGCVLLIVSAEG